MLFITKLMLDIDSEKNNVPFTKTTKALKF